MTGATHLARWRALALVGAFALLFALLPLTFASAQQQPQPVRQAVGVADLNANDNVGSAISWSDFTFETRQQAILGRNDLFADNLASGTLQRLDEGGLPLLLTDNSQLSARTRQELEQLGTQVVHVLGGSDAIAPAVTEELEQMAIQVHRHAGATRIETAIDIAQRHFPEATTGILARAYGSDQNPTAAFADSLAAGAWGADTGFPVLLTLTGDLPATLRAFLQESALSRIFVVGGPDAISDNVVQQLRQLNIEVVRVAGETRFGTAVQVAHQRGFTDASVADNVVLVPGVNNDAWASGFPAAAWSALNNGPIVLSAQDEIPQATQQWLTPGGADTFLVCAPFADDTACARAAALLDKPVIQLEDTQVAGGGQLTGQIEGNVDRLIVNGCGFNDQDVQVDQNGAFALTFSNTVEGACELRFTVIEADGDRLDATFVITVEGEATEQTFIVAPQQPRTFEPGQSADFSVTRFDEQPFTGPVDVVLFPCQNVAATAQVKTFVDADNDNLADGFATTDTGNALIATLNGQDIQDTRFIPAAQPGSDDILRFTVTSGAQDCTVPVVFNDVNDNNQLDLNEDDTPAEPFGLGKVTFAT